MLTGDNQVTNEDTQFQAPTNAHHTPTEVKQELDTLKEEVAKLRAQINMARGTRETTKKQPRQTLAQSIEAALRANICTTEDLSKHTGQTKEAVMEVIRANRSKIANLGMPERAKWSWRIGDNADPKELRALVERLITHQPMEFRDLCSATGARESLVQGHLVELRKTKSVLDFGTPFRARWFLVPEGARNAKLVKRE